MNEETKRKIEDKAKRHKTVGNVWTEAAFKEGAHFGHELGVQEEKTRIRFFANEYFQAYAPDFFNEPPDFTPKLDMNSAALVRLVLEKILLTPPTDKEEQGE